MNIPHWNWNFNFESFANFLQGGLILCITEMQWVGIENHIQAVLKAALLTVSLALGIKSFLKKDGKAN